MAVYFKKYWGFPEPAGPLVFSRAGWRERARKDLVDGDLVIIAGTTGEETAEPDRGLVLGILEPSREPVAAIDFIDKDYVPEHQLDSDGHYRWPYGLLTRRAWKLVDRPPLRDLLRQHRNNREGASGLCLLTDEEAALVGRLRKEEIGLKQPLYSTMVRLYGEEEARRKYSPPPSNERAGSTSLGEGPAATYAMELVGASKMAFKIGRAKNWQARAKTFNQHAIPSLGGIKYKPILHHEWPCAQKAHDMEQELLSLLDDFRLSENHEVVVGITLQRLESAWRAALERVLRG